MYICTFLGTYIYIYIRVYQHSYIHIHIYSLNENTYIYICIYISLYIYIKIQVSLEPVFVLSVILYSVYMHIFFLTMLGLNDRYLLICLGNDYACEALVILLLLEIRHPAKKPISSTSMKM